MSNTLSADMLLQLFPFHMVITRQLHIQKAGSALSSTFSSMTGRGLEGRGIDTVFSLDRPLIPFTWDSVSNKGVSDGLLVCQILGVNIKGGSMTSF